MNLDQEELINIKAIARLMPESQARNHIFLLLAHIDAQAGQIEALKALLIDDRCKCIILIEKLKVVANDPKWMEKGMKKSLDEYMDEARKQLAEDPDLKAAGVTWK